jgi:hypothetical protein
VVAFVDKAPASVAIASGAKLRGTLAATALLSAGRGLPLICFVSAVDSCYSGGGSFLGRATGLAAASAATATAAVVAACVQRLSTQGAGVPGSGLVNSTPFMLAVLPGHVGGADAPCEQSTPSYAAGLQVGSG